MLAIGVLGKYKYICSPGSSSFFFITFQLSTQVVICFELLEHTSVSDTFLREVDKQELRSLISI